MTEKLPARRGLDRLGYWCANHRAVVIVGWLVVLVLATVAHRVAGGSYSDNFDLPGSQSQQGADLLSAHEAAAGGQSGQIVFVAPNGATVQAKQKQVESSVKAVGALPHVLNVSDPLSPQTTSKDGGRPSPPSTSTPTPSRSGPTTSTRSTKPSRRRARPGCRSTTAASSVRRPVPSPATRAPN